MRKIVFGDIHGCSIALNVLLGVIDPQPDDTIITLGDYIDRGPNSKGVIDRLIALKDQCNYVSIMGNHELMLMRAAGGKDDLRHWVMLGGAITLRSYGHLSPVFVEKDELKKFIPFEHMQFIMDCIPYHEDDDDIFVHANYDPDVPMQDQREEMSFWTHLNRHVPGPHMSGKTAWVGHTPQRGVILDLGHVVCVDTYVFHPERGGWLTAVDVDTRQIWQANEHGELRDLGDIDTDVYDPDE